MVNAYYYSFRNGDLSRPQPGVQGRQKLESQWDELTDLLNSVGTGVQKQSDKWKRVMLELLIHLPFYIHTYKKIMSIHKIILVFFY